MHDNSLALAIQDLLDQNRPCVASVHDTFRVLDWNKNALFIKDGPMAANDLVNLLLEVSDRYLPYLATRYITSTYMFLTYLLAHITLSSY
jgi:hypothetical protein